MQFECKTNEDNESLMRRLSRECREVLVEAFTLAMSENSHYNAESTFDILTYVATNKTYIETAVKQLRKGALGKEVGVVQSADTVLNRLKGKEPEELLKEARKANQRLLARVAKKGAFKEPLDVAVDIHDIYRYTKMGRKKRKKNCDDWQKVVGTKPKGSAYYAHQYMTLESINTQEQYALAFQPKLPLKKKEAILEELIERAEEDSGATIARIFHDGGFYTTETIRVCKRKEKHYAFITDMLPSKKQDTLDFCIDLAKDYGKRWGIETGYRDKIQFRGFTHSLNYSVRLFLFLLSVLLYNLWRHINRIISENPRFLQWYGEGMTKSDLSFMLGLAILEAVGIVTIRR